MPEDLTNKQKRELMAWVKVHYPRWYTADRLRWVVGETLDYHRSIDNRYRYTSWVSVVRNRIRHLEAKGWDPFQTRLQFERPQEERQQAPAGMAHVADVIQLRRKA